VRLEKVFDLGGLVGREEGDELGLQPKAIDLRGDRFVMF
jgi:hypothetical protein